MPIIGKERRPLRIEKEIPQANITDSATRSERARGAIRSAALIFVDSAAIRLLLLSLLLREKVLDFNSYLRAFGKQSADDSLVQSLFGQRVGLLRQLDVAH